MSRSLLPKTHANAQLSAKDFGARGGAIRVRVSARAGFLSSLLLLEPLSGGGKGRYATRVLVSKRYIPFEFLDDALVPVAVQSLGVNHRQGTRTR